MDLNSQKCIPCQVGEPSLKGDELKKYLDQVPEWKIQDEETKIIREFEFSDFNQAIEFINKLAQVAEAQGHHPDFCLHDYKKVQVTLSTHKIKGLHQNDFILATKINKLYNT